MIKLKYLLYSVMFSAGLYSMAYNRDSEEYICLPRGWADHHFKVNEQTVESKKMEGYPFLNAQRGLLVSTKGMSPTNEGSVTQAGVLYRELPPAVATIIRASYPVKQWDY